MGGASDVHMGGVEVQNDTLESLKASRCSCSEVRSLCKGNVELETKAIKRVRTPSILVQFFFHQDKQIFRVEI
jgi:hypothetical protein